MKWLAFLQCLLFWLFEGDFKVSPCTVEWYASSYGTDFDTSAITSPVSSVVRGAGLLYCIPLGSR